MNSINLFNNDDQGGFINALKAFFEELKVPVDYLADEPASPADVLGERYKTTNEAHKLIADVYALGMVNDGIFEGTETFKNLAQVKKLKTDYDGLLIFGVTLNKRKDNLPITRSHLAEITRAFNRTFPYTPVTIIFKYNGFISFANSERIKYKQEWREGEKVGKVIIVQDVDILQPHTGHLRILLDLTKPNNATNYKELLNHWNQVLDVSILNKKFFADLSNLYFWAMDNVSFPDDLEKKKDVRNATNLIRLITRVVFIWFIKEKKLVPNQLFDKDYLKKILKSFNPANPDSDNGGNYYNAILQNLFFGTLNQKMDERKFVESHKGFVKSDQSIRNFYRYPEKFVISEKEVVKLFADVPFLNGGLFDCLDKTNEETKKDSFVDGFTRIKAKQASVPDYIFFGEEREVDLNEIYATKNKKYKSRGLLNLLESYKFTVAENTPLEEEVALDPELLGKVFENLLASYNPETQTTARKQTGSFYTPREIVNYMVDESLLEYLKSYVSILADGDDGDLNRSKDASDTFFNPNNEIQIHQGNLPHWQQENVWYFITFRLADSIPADVVEKIKSERELWLKRHPKEKGANFTRVEQIEYHRLFSERIEDLLNSGKGSCVLKDNKISKIVSGVLLHFNNDRYILDEWVIMPNHVHVLVKPLGEYQLPDILHSWKSFSANEINEALGTKGQFWMHESYDHIVRNEQALEAIRKYIKQNPIKANLKEGEYLISESSRSKDASETFETRLRDLISYSETPNPFDEKETKTLITGINNCKILDPACGSGAYPMGILHKMVHLLQKLDPENKYWKALQRQKAMEETETAFKIGDKEERGKRLNEINDVFENNASDYGRKLYLIENCIYGIDIQPIAVQISKLRFFISLIIDQQKAPLLLKEGQGVVQKENFGIRSLPNLETKFVAANTLIGLDKPAQTLLRNPDIEVKEIQLKELRHKYFTANTRKEKLQYQKQDKKLRQEIAKMLESDGWQTAVAKQIVAFDPYDQNTFAPWFDPEWMFGLTTGFDVVIGNPPYVSAPSMVNSNPEMRKAIVDSKRFITLYQKWDLYIPFMELGLQLLRNKGIFTMIVPYPITNQTYGLKFRELTINKYNLLEIVDLNGTKIFENATVSNCIPFISKSAPGKSCFISKLNGIKEIQKEFTQNYTDLIQDKDTLVWNLTSEKREANRHSEMNVLGDYCYISVGMVLNADEKKAKGEFTKDDLISESYDKIHCRKYIEAKDIERYNVKKIRYLEYNTERSPDQLRRPTFRELYEKPKLMFNRLGEIQVILDSETKFLHSDSMYSAVLWKDLEGVENKSISASIKRYSNHTRKEMVKLSKGMDLRYLLGIMNSKYGSFLLSNLRGGDYHIYPEHIRNIQIPTIPKNTQKPFITIVDFIILQKKENVDSSFFERLIDAMLYELYLPEEIKAGGAEVLKHLSNLPELKEGQDESRSIGIKTIEKVYKELSDPKHPISAALLKLLTIEEVNIIEGRK